MVRKYLKYRSMCSLVPTLDVDDNTLMWLKQDEMFLCVNATVQNAWKWQYKR